MSGLLSGIAQSSTFQSVSNKWESVKVSLKETLAESMASVSDDDLSSVGSGEQHAHINSLNVAGGVLADLDEAYQGQGQGHSLNNTWHVGEPPGSPWSSSSEGMQHVGRLPQIGCLFALTSPTSLSLFFLLLVTVHILR